MARAFLAGSVIIAALAASAAAMAQDRPPPARPVKAIAIEGENCPPGTAYVTYDEAMLGTDSTVRNSTCSNLGDNQISRIGNGGSMAGRGFDRARASLCMVKREDDRALASSLCKATADPPLPMPEEHVPPPPLAAGVHLTPAGGCRADIDVPVSVQEAVDHRAELCGTLRAQLRHGDLYGRVARLAEGAGFAVAADGVHCEIARLDVESRHLAFCKPKPAVTPEPPLPLPVGPPPLPSRDINVYRASACPLGTLPITVEEAVARTGELCPKLSAGDYALLADGGAMAGPQDRCRVHRRSSRSPTAAICWNAVVTDGDGSGIEEAVRRFAPVLKFDQNGGGYPMSAQPLFDRLDKDGVGRPIAMPGEKPLGVENADKASLAAGTVPTYYQLRWFGSQVRIRYWWFYGFQHSCGWWSGAHNGDWENIVVILNDDRSSVAAVRYQAHGMFYTRIAGPRDAPCTPAGTLRCERKGFEKVGERPVVYVGRYTHASYDRPTESSNPLINCAVWSDARQPGAGDTYDTSRKLVNLDRGGEPWMRFDRDGGWAWGPDGISRHPSQEPPTADLKACNGSATSRPWDSGCYNSECLAGDDEASENCLKECKPGYTNIGLIYSKSLTDHYGRLQGDRWYRYDYRIPLTDIGLARRRNSSRESEWDLP